MSDAPVKRIEPFVGPLPDVEEPFEVQVKGTVATKEKVTRRFRTGSATFSNGNETAQIVGADPKRRAMVIVNSSTQTVWLLGNRSDSAGNGFPLTAGAALTMNHQAEVFGVCLTASSAAQATIYYAMETDE